MERWIFKSSRLRKACAPEHGHQAVEHILRFRSFGDTQDQFCPIFKFAIKAIRINLHIRHVQFELPQCRVTVVDARRAPEAIATLPLAGEDIQNLFPIAAAEVALDHQVI